MKREREEFGEKRRAYLDCNATTPLGDEAFAELTAARSAWGNCSSPHFCGLAAKGSLEKSRAAILKSLGGMEGADAVFTGGGTESNNLAIVGAYRALRLEGKGNHIISTNVEHPSVSNVLRYLEEAEGAVVSYLPVDGSCVITAEQVKAALRRTTVLVTVMHANNEVGSIMPIAEIAEVCRAKGVLVHTDCAQTIGKVPVSLALLGVDFLSVCGHKFYGPKGSGALVMSAQGKTVLRQVTFGAGHELGLRPGTESTMLAAALAAAVVAASSRLITCEVRNALREYLTESLRTIGHSVEFNSDDTSRTLPNTVSAAIRRDRDGAYILAADVARGIGDSVAVSAGSACHSVGTHLSHVLQGMGLSPERSLGTLRLTVGKDTTVDEAIFGVDELCRFLATSKQAHQGK